MKEETEIALLKQSMTNIEKKFDDFCDSNSKAHLEIKEMIEKAMSSKADAWVEDALKWVIYTVMGIVITALVYLVIK
jgi:hypothetical protein